MEIFDANPEMRNMLFSQMKSMGIEPERYIVGNELNSINPVTGQPEFFLKRVFNGVKDVLKEAAPIIIPIAINAALGPAGSVGGQFVLPRGWRHVTLTGPRQRMLSKVL